MNGIKRVYEGLCKVEERAAQVLLGLTVLVVFVAAVARYAGYPLAWSIEFACFLFAWAAFFAADVALREDRHVSVDYFVDKLPPRVRAFIKLVNYVIILVFLICLIVYGIQMSYLTRFRAFQGIPGFSYMWATLSVPVGSLLLVITTITKIRQTAAVLRRETSHWPPNVSGVGS